jgi:ATP-dependent DNA ligase
VTKIAPVRLATRRGASKEQCSSSGEQRFQPPVAGVNSILFSDALVADGALVFAKACELGLEGIVETRRKPILERTGNASN